MSTINLTQVAIDTNGDVQTVTESSSVKAEYRAILRDVQNGKAILVSNSPTQVVYLRKNVDSGCPACKYTFDKEEVADPVVPCEPYTC